MYKQTVGPIRVQTVDAVDCGRARVIWQEDCCSAYPLNGHSSRSPLILRTVGLCARASKCFRQRNSSAEPRGGTGLEVCRCEGVRRRKHVGYRY